ncbi:MAG: DUF84 family protein [Halodesulfurarchaeum sp.]
MRVGVGSTNPVKRNATERVVGDIATTIDALDVDSGVSEQPTSDGETVRGARNRAERALALGDYDFGVGIEGGVARIEAVPGLYLTMWAVTTDGTTVGRGSGPRLRLPDRIADRIQSGAELGPVMDDVLDTQGIARREGAAGVLSARSITRESALANAIAGSFGPFVTDYY